MTPIELKEYLRQLVVDQLPISVMIWGAPGIGKSSIVCQIAAETERQFIDVRLSQLAPTDLRGLPVPKEGITHWFPPEFLPHGGKGILFLDEINMAPPAMQGVAQQLILDRRVGNYEVPEGWVIWSAGNRKEDRASVFDMPSPLANRFIHLQVEATIEDFRRYAFEQGFSDQLIGFLSFRQDLLHKLNPDEMAWPSPRSWEMAEQLHRSGLDVEPSVGAGAAAEYYAYLSITENIPDIDAIVAGTKSPAFPSETSLRYATVMSLVSRSDNSDKALNAIRWLVAKAMPEWTQLYATDSFPRLRACGCLEVVHKEILEDDKLRGFLTEFMQLVAA
jgi:MoxR-like ATPase